MSYSPTTDFLALLRQTAAGVNFERMPGLDFVLAALARAGMFSVSVGQTAPIVNQSSTAWLRAASPSWTAEGILYLWNAATVQYEVATPALWTALIASGGSYAFQLVSVAAGVVNSGVSLLAVQRSAPVTTSLMLPNLVSQWSTGRRLQVVDFSTAVARHVITLTVPDTATIMQRASWQLVSTTDQLTGVTLQPSPELNAWIIAP